MSDTILQSGFQTQINILSDILTKLCTMQTGSAGEVDFTDLIAELQTIVIKVEEQAPLDLARLEELLGLINNKLATDLSITNNTILPNWEQLLTLTQALSTKKDLEIVVACLTRNSDGELFKAIEAIDTNAQTTEWIKDSFRNNVDMSLYTRSNACTFETPAL